ncbi:G2/M Phase-Specific E3 Ubiquitin-Protein Ligase [Manis pentadactyla]|nr:G2/M Phase-Specific E3 Ubiquitin-Protein Ligase [Manis pentadactyla]
MKALPRTVKAEDPQLPRMRRKRRKAYKKWKILNATVCGPQSAHQACQNNIKDLEKEVKEDTSEAVFHQTEAFEKSKENGDKRASASVNGKQDSPLLPKDKKQSPSDSKISREKESDDSVSSISYQLEKVLPVVMFNDCEELLSGKITLKNFPSTVEAFKPAKGKIITEVKCGVFNVQVEIKNRLFCETGMQFPTKKRCPKCHQHYTVRHIPRSYTSRSCSSTYKNILIEELKLEAPSKSEGEITRTESPLLKPECSKVFHPIQPIPLGHSTFRT